MKKIFIAMALFVSVPAFANTDAVDTNEAVGIEELANEEFNVDEAYSESLMAAPPRRPGRPGNPGWGRPRRMVECVSQNIRGQRFLGRGLNRNMAARNSMNQCQRRSGFFRATCRVRTCRTIWVR